MAPDVKSLSWNRNDTPRRSSSMNGGNTRRRLSDMFDEEKRPQRAVVKSSPLREMKQFSLTKLRMPRASPTRRALRSGAEKIVRSFQQLRLSVDTFSQRLRGSTRRRCRLENVDTPMATPQTRSRRILGRTPTRLYSPFGIDTPNPQISIGPDTSRRNRAQHRHTQNEQQPSENNENERPRTRCMVQTRAMCISNHLLPDHDTEIFTSPMDPEDKMGICDKIVQFLFGGLLRWDAQYFLHIAKYGYTSENCLAFFPLFPFSAQLLSSSILSPFTLFFTTHSLIIISFVFLNVAFFVQAAQVLFDLSLVVLRDEDIAYRSAVFFCFTPASIFFSAPYSESLFALCTFHGLLSSELNRSKTSVISLSLACATRSNGVLNVGFTIHKQIRGFLQSVSTKSLLLILLIPLQLVGVIIPLLASITITILPFILFQVFSFGKFCIDDRQLIPKFIIEHAQDHNYKLPGRNPSDWCNSSVPLAYSYVQSHYWNVGFLKYYEMKQIPNFLLALPIIWIVLHLGMKFFLHFPRYTLLLGFSKSPRSKAGMPPADALPYIAHAVCLLIFCILCIHVQVTTRMLASSSPVLYWAAAYLVMPYSTQSSQNKYVESRQNVASNWKVFLLTQDFASHYTAKCVKIYFLLYMILGTVLFSNQFPWT